MSGATNLALLMSCGQNVNVAKTQMWPKCKCCQSTNVAKTQLLTKRKSTQNANLAKTQIFPKLEIELDMARNYLKFPEYLELAGNGWKKPAPHHSWYWGGGWPRPPHKTEAEAGVASQDLGHARPVSGREWCPCVPLHLPLQRPVRPESLHHRAPGESACTIPHQAWPQLETERTYNRSLYRVTVFKFWSPSDRICTSTAFYK